MPADIASWSAGKLSPSQMQTQPRGSRLICFRTLDSPLFRRLIKRAHEAGRIRKSLTRVKAGFLRFSSPF
jgi:hypothetical protein